MFKKTPYWLIIGLFFVAVGVILHTLHIYSAPFIDEGFDLRSIIGFMFYGLYATLDGTFLQTLVSWVGTIFPWLIILWACFFVGAIIGFIAEIVKYHKTFLITVLIIMSALFGLRYFQLANAHNTQQHAGLTLQDCAKISAPIERNDCYADMYQNFPPNPAICNKLNLSDRVSCAHYVGQESGDTILCKELKLPDNYHSCIAGVAHNKKDLNVCSLIQDSAAVARCKKIAQEEYPATVLGPVFSFHWGF